MNYEFYEYETRSHVSDILTSDVYQDKNGHIWATTGYGLRRFDGNEWHAYFHDADTTSISDNNTKAIYEDKHGRLWVLTINNGLDLYDREADRFIRTSDPIPNDARLWNWCEESDDVVWLASRGFLIKFDLAADSCTYFPIPEVSSRPNTVRVVVPDPDSERYLWCGMLFGLYKFDKQTGEFELSEQPSNWVRPDGSGDEVLIMDIVIDETRRKLWCGTWGLGLVSYDLDDKTWEKFPIVDYTDPTRWVNVVPKIRNRDEGSLWVTSSQGVSVFDMDEGKHHILPAGGNGELRESYSYGGIRLLSSGRIAFGGVGGFNVSDRPMPDYPEDQRKIYAPELSHIEVDGRPVLIDRNPAYLESVRMRDDEKDVRFTVTTPGSFVSDKLQYAFMLEGYDDDWQYSPDNSVRYTNLGGGEYALNFRVSADGENWVEGRSELVVKRDYSVWGHPATLTALVLIILSFIVVVYILNIRAIRRTARLKSEYDKRIAGVEMAALRAQMNPHFMFNSLNAIKTYILKERTKEASLYLTKFSQLMRAVLRNSKQPLVSLEEELHALNLYIELEMLRFDDGFELVWHVDKVLQPGIVAVPPLLIQPYVENAIRHGLLPKEGDDKRLEIRIDKNAEGQVVIAVIDNGVGREASSKKQKLKDSKNKSLGMSITSDRIDLIQQTLGITAHVRIIDLHEGGASSGTRVELTLPYIDHKEIDF